jgi:PD-(D/E)XK nuclease superfamily
VLGELGGRLSFDWDVEDAFSASQRDVATLYEYWAFLQLADALGAACGESRAVEALASTRDGLSLSFKQGQASAVRWRARAGGRELDVDLFFNRTFLVSAQPRTESSWSRGMRPDASVRVRPLSHLPELTDRGDLDLWLHFDAKYRLDAAREQFARASADDAEAAQQAEVVERTATTKREDLLKMHAYRDAIRRSAGAYVLYPGDDKSPPFREFAEVLPGLGAFVLRPGSSGEAHGRAELKVFLEAVLMHAAERASQHERDRYWRARVYAAPRAADGKSSLLPDLTAPPRDTVLLCGFLKSERHERWVRRVGTYNLRAGDRRGALAPDASELQAEWLLLYRDNGSRSLWTRDGSWFVQTREQLIDSGYPNPGGRVYLCAPVLEYVDAPSWLYDIRVDDLAPARGRPRGAPFAMSWGELLEG